jgi:hypothetical protein
MEDKEKIDALVRKFEEEDIRLGWSDLKGLAIEVLLDPPFDHHYIASRFEVTPDHAKHIIEIVDDFLDIKDGEEDELWLGTIRKYMKGAYLSTSKIASDYLDIHEIEGLDYANDFKDKFTSEQQKSLNMIATVIWQTMIAAIEAEGLMDEEWKWFECFDAVFEQVKIAHFG